MVIPWEWQNSNTRTKKKFPMFFDYKTDALRYDEGLSSLESERDDSWLFISESGAFFHKWKRCKIFLGENRTHPHNIVELNTYIAFSSCTTKELKIAHLENLYILKEKKWWNILWFIKK